MDSSRLRQPNRIRRLTKSRFQLARECPTKLAYSGKAEFGNCKEENPFLEALARGGFQVGELARHSFPEGVAVETLDEQTALAETTRLLQQTEVTIFEAALEHGGMFVRVDVLRKSQDQIFLYEVKAGSYDPANDVFFARSKNKRLLSDWEPYLYDVAFQAHVASLCFPAYRVLPYLVLVDKTSLAATDGLNQNFLVYRTDTGRNQVRASRTIPTQEIDLILRRVDVSEPVAYIHQLEHFGKSFAEWVQQLTEDYVEDRFIASPIGKQCKNCEFRIGPKQKAAGLQSGFDRCWKPVLGQDVEKPLVLDVWRLRPEPFLESGKYLLSHLTYADLSPTPRENGPGLSQTQRQWLQIEKTVSASQEPFLDRAGLATEMRSWKYPLHFIDFETAQMAIPFHAGRRPYETLAFQFSHHLVHADGRVEHAGQYIHRERGVFPNFDFVRQLKRQLENDDGTILRYAPHENTVLCEIYRQLKASQLPKSEIEELCTWIQTITRRNGEKKGEVLWKGEREMVDLRELVLRYYYHPLTGKSNSLKYVLPATLNASAFVQAKYSQAVYGSPEGISSYNFHSKTWVQRRPDGVIEDPYRSLGPILNEHDDAIAARIFGQEEVADGGAAMMAYAMMQFTEMSQVEEDRIVQALLRYCELDTLAMVMLYEYWQSEVSQPAQRSTSEVPTPLRSSPHDR